MPKAHAAVLDFLMACVPLHSTELQFADRATLTHARPAPALRTAILLAALTVFNAFDLGFTHSQILRSNFAEANPLVSHWLTGESAGYTAVVYKAVLFCFGAAILYKSRRRELAQASLWALTAFYAGLMVWWLVYLDAAAACLSDPAVVGPVVSY
jgi:hypothetical protein